MMRITINALLAAACFTAACDAPTPTSSEASDPKPAHGANESYNERVARQKQYIQTLDRYVLPAPDGPAEEVALAAIRTGESKCPRLIKATRINRDGSIIAECSGGHDFRIFNMEGLTNSMPLDCLAARNIYGIDACDLKAAESSSDDSIKTILVRLKRTLT